MTTLLEKVAGVLEAIADDIDNNSYVSTPLETAATNDAGEAEVSKLAHAYAQATGEAPSEEVLSELQANEAFKSTILKVAAQHPRQPHAPPERLPTDGGEGSPPARRRQCKTNQTQ